MRTRLRQRLHKRLKELENDILESLHQQEAEYSELTNTERVEPMDEAQVRMDSHTHGALQFHDEERLMRIRSALQRMEDGRYGICAACGSAIAEERLKAKPEAVFCIECERRHEKQGGGDAH